MGVGIPSSFSPTKFYKVNNIYSILRDWRKLTMALDYGKDLTYNKISARFFWYWIYNDVADFCEKMYDVPKIRKCDT